MDFGCYGIHGGDGRGCYRGSRLMSAWASYILIWSDSLVGFRNGSLDLLIGDKPLLDYYRGTDPSCNLIDVSEHERGDDTYAVAMARGFPLRVCLCVCVCFC